MLVLSRKVGESFVIGDDITVTVVRIAGGGVRIGVEAPTDCSVIRSELQDLLNEAADEELAGEHGFDS
ncbi:MAG: carbon storage regulator [Planctomycetaceae bacterium]|nr:carbon storage regulator [Planctomycetaceae bacterium]|tara:strand:+ start:63 stop:266 length:204 start_codon:yes stop_codon:yes gene_type:complete